MSLFRLFSRLPARLATFPAWDPDHHGLLLATRDFVCTLDGRIYCWWCCVYYGHWQDRDRALHTGHPAPCTQPGDTRPTAPGPQRHDARRHGFPDGALGPHLRLRERGVQDSGEGVAALCVGW